MNTIQDTIDRHERIALQLSGGRDSIEKITAEQIRNLFDYSVVTGVFYWRTNRKGHAKAGDIAGTPTDKGYIVIKVNGKRLSAHRLAWLYVLGVLPDFEIDHINRNRACNGFWNLREATSSQNKSNTQRASRNSTGHRGVYYLARTNKFYAKVHLRGKQYMGPCRVTAEEAAADAIGLRANLHGEFANHD